MRSPNQEQKIAIEHQGGVLLSAGAGSGKTFVLVQHVKHLIEKKIFEMSHETQQLQNEKLRKFFSSIVIMTFTRKATREISERLEKELENLGPLVVQNSSFLTVTTIDGLCYKLLTSGAFPDFSKDFQIVDSWEKKVILSEILREWILSIEKENKVIYSFFLKNFNGILISLFRIMESPVDHLSWIGRSLESEKKDASFLKKNTDEKLAQDLYILLEFEKIKKTPFIAVEEEKEWQKAYVKLFKLFSEKKFDKIEDFIVILRVFEETRKPRLAKDTPEKIKDFIEDVFNLRDRLKLLNEDIEAYQHLSLEDWSMWKNYYLKAFQYLSKQFYCRYNKRTFSDLSFFVAQGLEDLNISSRLRSQYDYFIIDEFQDTSHVQFLIVKKLVDNDLNKIFAIGDMKQAIYGFRGGEVSVFQNLLSNMNQILNLKNNYRSLEKVIEFNNVFFEKILHKGRKYTGIDRFKVEMIKQVVPDEKIASDEKGHIRRVRYKVPEGQKIYSKDFSSIEATILVDILKKDIEEFKNLKCCVLYRKLSPALYLIQNLIANNVCFNAQIKVPYLEDPLLVSFYFLVKGLCFRTKRTGNDCTIKYWCSVLDVLYSQIGQKDFSFNVKKMSNFLDNIELYGLFNAFQIWVLECGILSSNTASGLSTVEKLCDNFNEDVEDIYHYFDSIPESYSFTFYFGKNPEKISIMTVHASKGLEFDRVYLGGIHSHFTKQDYWIQDFNGNSFTYPNQDKNLNLKTPQYFLDRQWQKEKEFSESKRLFYVACTRAIHTITWIEIINENNERLYLGEESWANAIETFYRNVDSKWIEKNISVLEWVQENKPISAIENLKAGAPFYFHDPLGVSLAIKASQVGLVSELNATTLSTLALCPFKFYLNAICKIEGDFSLNDEHDKINSLSSTQERGNKIHGQLFSLVSKNKDIKILDVDIHWIAEKLLKLRANYTLIAEETIKFSFFGHMISCVPDLLLKPKEKKNHWEIWDYKTGERTVDKDLKYLTQVKIYAFALYQINILDKKDSLFIKIQYVDQRVTVEEEIFFDQLYSEMHDLWKCLGKLQTKNVQHCQFCEYFKICLGRNSLN